MFAFEGMIGGEQLQARAAGEGPGGGESGGETVPGGEAVHGKEDGVPVARADEGGGELAGLRVVAQENGERKLRDVEGGVHGPGRA